MKRNAPDLNLAANILDVSQQCIRPKWGENLSSMKYQQRFINQYYRCDYVKGNNTCLYLLQLPHTNKNYQNVSTEEPCQL